MPIKHLCPKLPLTQTLWLCLLCMLLFTPSLKAQYNLKENSNWVFGTYSGISFNNNTVTPITSGMSGWGSWIEGSASVSDSNGNLLFYSSADSIWDKTGHVLPNGFELMHFYYTPGHDTNYTGYNTTQGSLIVPVIDSPFQYYVFSLSSMYDYFNGDIIACRLFYSIVDMRLRGGLGDVVQNKKSIELDSMLSEKMIAIPGTNCDIWLMVHGRGNRIFKAYNITSNGINLNPIISDVGNIYGIAAYSIGEMKASNDFKKIAICNSQDSNSTVSNATGIEIFNFDHATGIVTNAMLLNNTIKIPYGLCFSPDNSKLYVNAGLSGIFQIDLSPSHFDSITWVENQWSSTATSLKLGLDNKMYFNSLLSADSISRIDSPNNLGFACHVNDDVMKLNKVFFGLPNQFVKPQCPIEVKNISSTINGVSLSPNPFSASFSIQNCKPLSLYTVYNIYGRQMLSGQIQFTSAVIETANWLQGMYIIAISTPEGEKSYYKMLK